MSGQQREAIMAAWEAIRPRTTNKLMEPKIYFDAGVEAALAAREDTEGELTYGELEEERDRLARELYELTSSEDRAVDAALTATRTPAGWGARGDTKRPNHYPTPVSQRMKDTVRAEQVKLDTEP